MYIVDMKSKVLCLLLVALPLSVFASGFRSDMSRILTTEELSRINAAYSDGWSSEDCDCGPHNAGFKSCGEKGFFRQDVALVEPGADYRERVASTSRRKSVGKINCTTNTGEPTYGTGWIAVPSAPSESRNFETIVSARHVLYNSDGTRRDCKFKVYVNGSAVEVPIQMPKKIAPFRANSYSETQDDSIVVSVNKRLTKCSGSNCAISASVSNTGTSDIEPYIVGGSRTSAQNEDLFENGEYFGVSSSGTPYRAVLKSTRVISNRLYLDENGRVVNQKIESSSNEINDDGTRSHDYDPHNRIFGVAENGKVVLGGWSSTAGSSGAVGVGTFEARTLDGELLGSFEDPLFMHSGSKKYFSDPEGRKFLPGKYGKILAPVGQTVVNKGVRVDFLESEIQAIHSRADSI